MSTRRPPPRWPGRFGPEWWALYAAAYVRWTEDAADEVGLDPALAIRSSAAERAAVVADNGIAGFREAVEGEAVTLTSTDRKRLRGAR